MINKSGADLEKIKNTVETCIEELVEKFRERPYIFYTEHDMHCYLYHLIYEELYENQNIGYCNTNDGEATVLLHEEYPPIDKEERRQRGHFDIVILYPRSVKRVKSISKSCNLRDENEKPATPFIAIELALDYDIEHLRNDYNKLTNPKNYVKQGYILHFMRDIDVIRRQKKKKKGFLDLLNEVERIRKDGKVKIWYLDNFYGNGIRKEIKWK